MCIYTYICIEGAHGCEDRFTHHAIHCSLILLSRLSLCRMSSVLCLPSCPLSCPMSSVLCPVSSVLCLLSSVLCPQSSVLCPLLPKLVSGILLKLFEASEAPDRRLKPGCLKLSGSARSAEML